MCWRWPSSSAAPGTKNGLDLTVAVNLSARDLLDQQFPDKVARLLARFEVPPAWLEIELTESGVVEDPVRAKQVLSRLSAMGIRLAVDDFGTGYSSLAYLRQLPLNGIKIDKSFVMDMAATDGDSTIVRSVIDLGRNLGLQMVAEGVETPEVLNRLASLGCDLAQGYLIGESERDSGLITVARASALVRPPWFRRKKRLVVSRAN